MSRFLPLLVAGIACAQYTATYLPSNAPAKSEDGQLGTNQCNGTNSQDSMCQNSYINGLDDFCLWAPPAVAGENAGTIGETERVEVAWCMKSGYGTRTIPDGAITGAHFVQTPDYVQITGVGDLTKLNLPSGDAGGELDPHGADGNGNPVGGLVFSSAFGQLAQVHEWTNFMSATQFCFRACTGPNAAELCQHIYDEMGCEWNMPANYDAGVFESCKGDTGEPMGVYGGSTFYQGQPGTPDPHPAPSSSSCQTVPTISNGVAVSSTSGTQTTATGSASGSQKQGSASSTGSRGAAASSTSASSSSSKSGSSSNNVSGRSVVVGLAAVLGSIFLGLLVV